MESYQKLLDGANSAEQVASAVEVALADPFFFHFGWLHKHPKFGMLLIPDASHGMTSLLPSPLLAHVNALATVRTVGRDHLSADAVPAFVWRKLQMLSLLWLAHERSSFTLDQLRQELCLQSAQEAEQLIIDAVDAGACAARIDSRKGCVRILSFEGRDLVDKAELDVLRSQLAQWHQKHASSSL